MPIIHKQHYTPAACLNLFAPTERNIPALLKFFTEMPDSDLTGLYKQHQHHGHWVHLEHSWQLVFLNGDHALVVQFLRDNRASNTLVDQYDRSIAHFAAFSGHAECLFAVLEKYPKLKDSVNKHGANIAHYAALSGDAECLFAVLEKYPKLKDSVDKHGANIAHFVAESNDEACLKAVLLRYPAWIASVIKPRRFILNTTLDIKRIVSEVKQTLEQQYLAAQQPESSSSLFDAHKPARVVAVSVPDAALSEDAKTHIRERVKQQLEWLAEEGLSNRDVVRVLQLLQQAPFDTATQDGREKDKEFIALVAGKDFELKYDLMHPVGMSKDIKPEQIESAREYLREVLASQEQALLKEPEKPARRKKKVRVRAGAASSSSVASQGVFARLAALPSPPDELPEVRGDQSRGC